MSIFTIYSLASRAKNSITLHSIPILILPYSIYLLCAYKDYGLYDLISQATGINRAFLMINAAIMDYQLASLLASAKEWLIKEGSIRYGLIFALIHPLAVYITSVYVKPSLALDNLNDDGASITSVELILLSGGVYLVSTLVSFYIGVIIGKVTRLSAWSVKEIISFLIVQFILASVLFVFLVAVVRALFFLLMSCV